MSVSIATINPAAVAINASATPPVTAWGCPNPVRDIMSKDCIMPTIVPRSPSRGASVIIVSRAGRNFFILFISSIAAASMAAEADGFLFNAPARRTLATGWFTFLASLVISSMLPLLAIDNNCSGVMDCFCLNQNIILSTMMVIEITEQVRMGFIIIPPVTLSVNIFYLPSNKNILNHRDAEAQRKKQSFLTQMDTDYL